MPTLRRKPPRQRNTHRIDFRNVSAPPSTNRRTHRTWSYVNNKCKKFHKWVNRNPRKVALMIMTASGLFLSSSIVPRYLLSHINNIKFHKKSHPTGKDVVDPFWWGKNYSSISSVMNQGKLLIDDRNMPRVVPTFTTGHSLPIPAIYRGGTITLSTQPLITFMANVSPMSILIVVIHELFHYYHDKTNNGGETSSNARETFNKKKKANWRCLEETVTCVRTLRIAYALGLHAQYYIGHSILWFIFSLYKNEHCDLNFFNTCYCDNVNTFQRHLLDNYSHKLV